MSVAGRSKSWTHTCKIVINLQDVELLWPDLPWRLGIQVSWNLCQPAQGLLHACEQDPVQRTPFLVPFKAPTTYMCDPATGSTGIRTQNPWIMSSLPLPLSHGSTQYTDISLKYPIAIGGDGFRAKDKMLVLA